MATQTEIAKAIGASQGFVSLFFSGKKSCSYRMAKKLADIFGLPAPWWMEASPEQKRAVLKQWTGK